MVSMHIAFILRKLRLIFFIVKRHLPIALPQSTIVNEAVFRPDVFNQFSTTGEKSFCLQRRYFI